MDNTESRSSQGVTKDDIDETLQPTSEVSNDGDQVAMDNQAQDEKDKQVKDENDKQVQDENDEPVQDEKDVVVGTQEEEESKAQEPEMDIAQKEDDGGQENSAADSNGTKATSPSRDSIVKTEDVVTDGEPKKDEDAETEPTKPGRKRKRVDSVGDLFKRSILRPRLGAGHAKPHYSEDETVNASLEVDPPGDSYPIKHPRYDNDAYQARLPDLMEKPNKMEPNLTLELDTRNLRVAQLKLNDRQIWGGKHVPVSTGAIDEYLIFCRRLTREDPPGGSNFIWKDKDTSETASTTVSDIEDFVAEREEEQDEGGDGDTRNVRKKNTELQKELNVVLKPLESDELALEFLHKNQYNIQRAKFHLLSYHGVGKETEAFGIRLKQIPWKSPRRATTPPPADVGDDLEKTSLASDRKSEDDDDEMVGKKRSRSLKRSTQSGDSSPSALYKKWMATARGALFGKIIPTRAKLYDLQLQLKDMRKPTDAKLVAAASELVAQLEKKLQTVDEWIANAHDMASMVKPDPHWSIEDMKDLLQHVPSGVKLAETQIVRNLYEKCEKIRKAARAALSDTIEINKMVDIIRRADQLPLDLYEIPALREKVSQVRILADKVRVLLPFGDALEKKSKRVLPKLSELTSLNTQIHALQVDFREWSVLENAIKRTQDWLDDASVAIENNLAIKDFLALVKRADLLPVDVSDKRIALDDHLKRAQECIAKMKNVVPKKQKTRGNTEVKKMELATLRVLKDEAASIGIPSQEIQDMENLIKLGDDWSIRVKTALDNVDEVDLDTLSALLDEAGGIPVLMDQEKLLKYEVQAKECVLEIEEALASKSASFRQLTKLQTKLGKVRKSFNAATPGKPSNKKDTKMKCDLHLKSVLKEAREWVLKVNFLAQLDNEEDEFADLINDVNVVSKQKKKKRNAKRAASRKNTGLGYFAEEDRISYDEFVDLKRQADILPMDLSSKLYVFDDIESSMLPLKLELRAILKSANQPEAERLPELLQTVKSEDVDSVENDNTVLGENKGDSADSSSENKDIDGIVASSENTNKDDSIDSREDKQTVDDVEMEDAPADKATEGADKKSDSDDMKMEVAATTQAVATSLVEIQANKRYTMAELDEKLRECQAFSVISKEEELFRECVDRARSWIGQTLRISPTIKEWDGVIADDKVEDGLLSVDTLGDMRKNANSLIVDVDVLVDSLEQVLKLSESWNERAGAILDRYMSLISSLQPLSDSDAAALEAEGNLTFGHYSNGRSPVPVDLSPRGTRGKRNKPHSLVKEPSKSEKNLALKRKIDADLGLTISPEEQGSWDLLENELVDRVKDKYGEGPYDGGEENTPVKYFTVQPRRVNAQSFGTASFDASLIAPVSMADQLLTEIVRSPASSIAVHLDVIKKVGWLVEASRWINAARDAVSKSLSSNMNTIRLLVAIGKYIMYGQTAESKVIVDQVLDYVSESGDVAASFLAILETPPTGYSREQIEGAPLKAISVGGCLSTLLTQLCKVFRNAASWDLLAKRKFSQAKSFEQLLGLQMLLDAKREKQLFPVLDSETLIVSEFSRMHDWLLQAHNCMRIVPTDAGKALTARPMKTQTSIEELEKLATTATKFKVQFSEVKDIRNAVKVAKQWLTKVKKTGIEKGEASLEQLRVLLLESQSIPVDLSEHTHILTQATRVYCVCRGAFDDVMVECMSCLEWYHIKCMGNLTQLVAKRSSGYCCPVCSVKRSASSMVGLSKAAIARMRMAEMQYAQQENETPEPPEDFQKYRNWANQCAELLSEKFLENDKLFVEKFRVGIEKPPLSDFADASQIYHTLQFRMFLKAVKETFTTKRKPTFQEVNKLRDARNHYSDAIGNHDFGAFLDHLLRRAVTWKERAKKAMLSDSQSSQGAIISECRSLLALSKHIPIILAEEKALTACVDDGANRYCICNGFNDGEFMIFCDDCEGWFHGRCVNLSQKVGDTLTQYMCPDCSKKKDVPYLYGTPSIKRIEDTIET
eukprot:CAMPEP_0203759188 /NCGR_PEP_ID=MMETSP0098-20131031/12156_1 /ASSEMBLY_ACC=CAM_ASM_000208 /TAXON_ID=96639 /ORGANISM=" , Strain NY0313808BC1" /LENGTH=1980 /DNA_ID=CAMNT_0050651993 /DNA_START=257 /DNA_END=6195 /DNA_ORIENTATION=-